MAVRQTSLNRKSRKPPTKTASDNHHGIAEDVGDVMVESSFIQR
jgi:hypothetical protein